MEKSTEEVKAMTYEEYCKYLCDLEEERNNTEYDELEGKDRTKYYVYGDLCMSNGNCENLIQYFWSDSIPTCSNIIKFRRLFQKFYTGNYDFPKTEHENDASFLNDVDQDLLQYLKESPISIHHHIKKFLYLRTQNENCIFHHYENTHYAKKFSVTALVDLNLSDLLPETCEQN
jgi:hypothetical protein